MAKVKEIIDYLEKIAPRPLQESYDNAGLQCGNREDPVEGIMICLDVTESVIEDAVQRGCNLLIAHHPLIFKGIKELTGRHYVSRTILKAIRHNLAIYAIHTNLDNIRMGVNHKFGEKLQLKNLKVLSPKKQVQRKLTTFVPSQNTKEVLQALSQAGAGEIGNYKSCSFRVRGTGRFEPNEQAQPHIGQANQPEEVDEDRIEVIFPSYLEGQVLAALKKAHPYEEVAYYLHLLENEHPEIGNGMVGELLEPMEGADFLLYLKKQMNLNCIRHTELLNKPVKKVAFCGGAGGFLLKNAINQQSDVFITADIKYHEFFEADGKILLADIGHYESEVYTKELIYELINKNFTNIALVKTEVNTNPIRYK
ncbi:MAG: Nif3-like dinuclear metal center hexameric protein [Candidatus Cyclobacteriaceae bacterium M3_2C_046]